MAEYGVTVRHFAERTLKNLKTIDDLSKEAPKKYFEVTQLVNSAIGLRMRSRNFLKPLQGLT